MSDLPDLPDLPGCYDLDGRPCHWREWAELHEDVDNVRVALDRVGDAEVSTVWVGIWLWPGFLDGDPPTAPLIYETVVFGGPLDGKGERYTHRYAALAGHDQWVAVVREAALRGVADDIRREFGFDE